MITEQTLTTPEAKAIVELVRLISEVPIEAYETGDYGMLQTLVPMMPDIGEMIAQDVDKSPAGRRWVRSTVQTIVDILNVSD